MKKPWPYNPQYSRIHIRTPSKDPGLRNQVPILGFVAAPGRKFRKKSGRCPRISLAAQSQRAAEGLAAFEAPGTKSFWDLGFRPLVIAVPSLLRKRS